MQPLVTAVIPVYNRAWCVRRAVASVLAQDYRPLELIVVDDGSTDDTPRLLDEIAREHAERQESGRGEISFGILRRERGGVSAARNLGIENARGDLIALLDSDDEWRPEKTTLQAARLLARPGLMLNQTGEIWIRRGVRVNPPLRLQKKEGDLFERCLDHCAVSPSAVLMRRELLEEVGGFDESFPVCEDYEMWLRVACRHEVGLLPETLIVKHGGHEDQLSRAVAMDRYRIRAILKTLESGLLSPEQTRLALRALEIKSRIYAEGCRKRGRESEAAEILGRMPKTRMKIDGQSRDAETQREEDSRKKRKRRKNLFSAFCVLLCFLCSSVSVADTVFETPRFRLTASAPGSSNLEYWGDFCEKALDRLISGGPDMPADGAPLGPGKVEVLVCITAEDFERASGMRFENTAAVAQLDRGRMILNIHVLRSLSNFERYQTVGHELVHLLLARLESRNRIPVPAWLHEGLAQLMVGEIPPGRALRLAWAGVFNQFLPMNRLATRFPYGGPNAELAYAQSASFTRHVATRSYSFSEVADFFHTLLRDTPAARAMLRDLNDPITVEVFETRWRRESGKALYWFLAITSSTLLWGAVVALFLIAYFRKRRREKAVMEDWDEWERMD